MGAPSLVVDRSEKRVECDGRGASCLTNGAAVCLNVTWPGSVDQLVEPQLECGSALGELQSGPPAPGWAC